MTDLVTILIPVYERVDFFEEALESAINQTVQCKIIVSDNGSSHNKFEEICSRYGTKVEFHKNETNIGMFPNWNKLISYATTEFVTILGDDDIIAPNTIETFLDIYNKNKEIGLFYSKTISLYEPSKTYKHTSSSKNLWGKHKMEELKSFAVKKSLGFPAVTSVCRRDLLLQNPFEERIHGSNDWLSLYNLADDIVFYGLDKELYTYRIHKKSDTQRPEMFLTMLLNCYLLLSYLSIKHGNFLCQLRWFGNLSYLSNKNQSFFNNYLSTESRWKDIYLRVKENEKLLKYSRPIGAMENSLHKLSKMIRRII